MTYLNAALGALESFHVRAREQQHVGVPVVPLTVGAMEDLQLVRFVSWAGYAILLLEFALTLPDEVEHIWPSRWSLVKGIFLGNRYGSLVLIGIYNTQLSGIWTSDSPSFCFKFALLIVILMFLSFASIHVLVLLRAWAVWGRSPKILASLIALFILYATACISIAVYSTNFVGPHAFPYVALIGVCISPMPRWLWTLWVPRLVLSFNPCRPEFHVGCSLALELGTFLLTFVTIRHNFQGKQSTPIVCTIYRDGAIYFIFSLLTSMMNILVWAYTYDRLLNTLSIVFTLALVTVAGQRLVLDLRKMDHLEYQTRDPRSGEVAWQIEPIGTSAGAPADDPIVFELATIAEGIDGQHGDPCCWSRRRLDTECD
ncbi:hypothetical protein OE88DRAFT_841194 [Heliocybe sulcata]|uniref:DUF6533 domain-containing protein n=1 Tax=Heliocybe sulcata TaxID=5364 RepID=A0A5C3MPY0_9AGAM|nr:hypothetical protein OE88DRAFT_841194 [Heliocybe sulcata]